MLRIFIMTLIVLAVVGYIAMIITKKYHQLKEDEAEYEYESESTYVEKEDKDEK